MEIKTTNEIFRYADSIPDDAKYDEIHEKFLDTKWVKVDDLKKYLDKRIERYISYCIKCHKDSEIMCACHDVQFELLRLYNLDELSEVKK
jgi:hypothetical protein